MRFRSPAPGTLETFRLVANAAGQATARFQEWQHPRRIFTETHGGHDGWNRPDLLAEYPVPSRNPRTGRLEAIEMGPLTRIAYLADKGDGIQEWIHDFDPSPSLPILCFSPSGLIIARGESRYRVDPHGIHR